MSIRVGPTPGTERPRSVISYVPRRGDPIHPAYFGYE